MNVVGPQAFVTDRNLERALDPALVPAGGRTGPRRAATSRRSATRRCPADRGGVRRSCPSAARPRPRRVPRRAAARRSGPTRRSRAGRRGTSPGSGPGPRSRAGRPSQLTARHAGQLPPGPSPQPGTGPDRPPPRAARTAGRPSGRRARRATSTAITGSHTIANQIRPVTIAWPAPISVANAPSTSVLRVPALRLLLDLDHLEPEGRHERPVGDLVLELRALALELLDLAADVRSAAPRPRAGR